MANSFEYAIIRVVPRVEREEFINAGVLLYCLSAGFLDARVELDVPRLQALWPLSEAEVEVIRGHLEAISRICAGGESGGPIGRLSQRERWHWLVAPRSTLVQLSPAHAGLCESPVVALEQLLTRAVRAR
jgi:hypothetical protein